MPLPNWKFEFCNCTSLFVTCCYLPNNYFQIYWKKTTLSSVKLICKRTNVSGSATMCKTGQEGQKTTRTADTYMYMRLRMLSFVTRSTASAVRSVFSLILPLLAFLPIHWQFMRMSTFTGQSIFLCSTSTFSVNLAVIVRNVTSPKNGFV